MDDENMNHDFQSDPRRNRDKYGDQTLEGDNDFIQEDADAPIDRSQSRDTYKNLSMDNKGKIHSNNYGEATVERSSTLFTVLGWICAALTAFISPLFAIGGIIFGVMLNRASRGRGNAIIITNVVLAAINILFGLFIIVTARRMLFGY